MSEYTIEGLIAELAMKNAVITQLAKSNEELLEAAKAALVVIDKTQGADRLGILLAKALAKADGNTKSN